MPDMKPAVDKVKARRIGFVSDTHFMEADGSDVPPSLTQALADSDLIVHLGHISSAASLDRLGKVAPVLAVRTALDDQLLGEGLKAEVASGRVRSWVRVIEAGGLRIGCVHSIDSLRCGVKCSPEGRMAFGAKTGLSERLAKRFGGPVDVVAFANTHIEVVAYADGVLFVNPGSPNLPGGDRRGGAGTIAKLDLAKGAGQVDVIEVARS